LDRPTDRQTDRPTVRHPRQTDRPGRQTVSLPQGKIENDITERHGYLDFEEGGSERGPFEDDLQEVEFGLFPGLTSLLIEISYYRLQTDMDACMQSHKHTHSHTPKNRDKKTIKQLIRSQIKIL
jgi:hypothetical protein